MYVSEYFSKEFAKIFAGENFDIPNLEIFWQYSIFHFPKLEKCLLFTIELKRYNKNISLYSGHFKETKTNLIYIGKYYESWHIHNSK